MATIAETKELDVLSKYKSLVKESLSGSSIYVKTKETLQKLLDENELTQEERGQVLSNVMASLSTALAQSAMNTALEWASQEKSVALKLLELQKQLDILDLDKGIKEIQKQQGVIDARNRAIEGVRLFGTGTVDLETGAVGALSTTGKVYEETLNITQARTNAEAEKLLLDSRLKESQASVHKVIADTYTNYGNFTYTIGETGLTAVTNMTSVADQDSRLAAYQANIAKEQAKGYAYNAWASAATGLSSMAGTALTVDVDIFKAGQIGETMIRKLNETLDKLRNVETIADYVYLADETIKVFTRTREVTINTATNTYVTVPDWGPWTEATAEAPGADGYKNVYTDLTLNQAVQTEVEYKVVKY